jgi:two-component system cell cycle sensor histidine kinase/response regulator CckA
MAAGRAACITVFDTGTAVNDEDLVRIFEPFGAGTRPRGGTGLELATVHGTIRRHRGAITAESDRGRGTTFTILIPALTVEEEDAIDDTTAETVTPLPRLSVPEIRRVAVVEDEVIVRNTLVAILRAYDIEPVVPRDAEEALEMLTVASPRVDALITDVRMPGMSGPALARALRAVHPDLPVLLVSGHADVALDQLWADTHALGFLPKPFTPNQLLAALRALMIVPRGRR